ncbi:oxidoreductase [Histomonas meleagridis]|uniref:oxidoreductase n=1 Tax=Histomonas meleagridis TaxID=135588 RepID=UPI00355A523C|nr:oxidoreductase [Histomonas meleagridis]KAH0798040.1 oxidoreductase [Histomonas meleagridis]
MNLGSIVLLVYFIIAIIALIVFIIRKYYWKKVDVKNKTVVITGGSSGVGLSLAQESFNRGAGKVVLIARNQLKLDSAKKSLKTTPDQEIITISADLCKVSEVISAFDEIRNHMKKIDFLFINAGSAQPQLLKDMTYDDIESQTNVNFTSALLTMKAALPFLGEGSHVNFSGSICSIYTFSGYAGYGSAKFALRGLGDTLRNEFKHTGIKIHFSIISSVDTPGYKVECLKKPLSCQKIEGTCTLFKPEYIASMIFRGIDRGDYYITMEFLSYIMLEINYGIEPSNNFFLQLLVAPLIPLFRLGALIYADNLSKYSDPLIKEKVE